MRIVKFRDDNVGVVCLEVSWVYGNKENFRKYGVKSGRYVVDWRMIYMLERGKSRDYYFLEIKREIVF